MKLTKIEIQQMLREMNIRFKTTETYENLRNILRKENHNQWLKSINITKCNGKQLILKRKNNYHLQKNQNKVIKNTNVVIKEK